MTDSKLSERRVVTNTLYSLAGEYLDVLALLEDPDADATALEQHLDDIAGLLTQKADNIAALVQQFEGMAALRKAEADRMRDLATADQRNADRLRDYVLRHMQALGVEKLSTTHFNIRIRTNPPSVQILEEMLIPEQFVRTVTTTSVDRRSILANYKSTGDIPPGIEISRGSRLDIQ